jgi:hypothetical protein
MYFLDGDHKSKLCLWPVCLHCIFSSCKSGVSDWCVCQLSNHVIVHRNYWPLSSVIKVCMQLKRRRLKLFPLATAFFNTNLRCVTFPLLSSVLALCYKVTTEPRCILGLRYNIFRTGPRYVLELHYKIFTTQLSCAPALRYDITKTLLRCVLELRYPS